jgi:radical SAM superfamily enzyme YgiQ (UPF0313 family)
MSDGTIAVGWVHLYSGLNMRGQRPDEEKLHIPQADRKYQDSGGKRDWEGIPYPIGLLQAFVQAHAPAPERYRFGVPVHRRMPVEEAVDRLDGSDVVGFSTYVWNVELSLAIARRLKERRPDTLTVFGGPQVPNSAEEFLRRHPYVDVAVHGEGERAFLELLEHLPDGDRSDLFSISYVDDRGRFVQRPRAPRIESLEAVPSPYLSGAFDALLDANEGSIWYAVVETNRGCPFACTFCDWGSAVNTRVRQFEIERVQREIEWLAAHKIEYVFCCDANFGMFPRDVDIARHVGEVRRASGYPIIFATQATKNATERSYAVQMMLAEDGVQGAVTISYQSMDPHTLGTVKRQNISLSSFSDLQARYVAAGVPTYTDMILGLPGETYDSYTRGLEAVIAAGQHERIAFYDCALLPNAELASPESRRQHGLLTVLQRIIVPHAPVAEAGGDVPEFLEIVVGTASMPPDDWRRAKVHGWWLEMLYFDRLFHVPFAIASAAWKVSIRELVEAVMAADAARFPLTAQITARFEQKAREIAAGGPQLTPGDGPESVWWPPDQRVLIDVVSSWKLDALFDEVGKLLGDFIAASAPGSSPDIWSSAVELGRRTFRRPFYITDVEWEAPFDLWGFYLDVVSRREASLGATPARYRVTRTGPPFRSVQEWCDYIVLCHNHKTGYAYPLSPAKAASRRDAA